MNYKKFLSDMIATIFIALIFSISFLKENYHYYIFGNKYSLYLL